jgi:hypothetical protein
MSVIAIDARIISTGTGRYIRGLLKNLEAIDQHNQYLILVRQKDTDYYKPTNANFKVIIADFPDYSFSEQLGFNRLLHAATTATLYKTSSDDSARFESVTYYRK